MKYVLGIDSGGTKYLIRATGLDGAPLGCDVGPAANHYTQPYDEVVRLIGESIDRCLAQFGGKREECAYLLSGSTGCDSEEDQALLDRLYRSLPGFSCPVCCVNDGELAHYTATGGEGVLLIGYRDAFEDPVVTTADAVLLVIRQVLILRHLTVIDNKATCDAAYDYSCLIRGDAN